MRNLVLVAVGGALGSVARYLVATWAGASAGGFPRGTLLVNLIGSFVISVVLELSLRSTAVPASTRLFVVTGVLGGFTTYSSFNYETLRLLDQGAVGTGLLNLGLTVAGCLGAGTLGLLSTRALLRLGAGLVGR